MSAPEFLTLDEVLDMHAELVERYGGSVGVRDIGLLQSALAAPQSGMAGVYFHGDVYDMAAAYLYHIIKNHPFVDGNKRTGAVAAIQFLWLNGKRLNAPSAELERLILDVAESKADKSQVSAFFKQFTKARI